VGLSDLATRFPSCLTAFFVVCKLPSICDLIYTQKKAKTGRKKSLPNDRWRGWSSRGPRHLITWITIMALKGEYVKAVRSSLTPFASDL